MPADWSKVNLEDLKEKLGQSSWDEDTNTCQVYSSALIKVVTASQGFTENLMQYVVDIEVVA